MSSAWEQQGCRRCRDAWSSLAKDIDRTVVSAVKRGDTGVLYKCRVCGTLWEEWMGGKGPVAITPEEAEKKYGYRDPEALLFEIPAPSFVSFGHTGDYARACKGSVVRQVHGASTDDRFRISVGGGWIRFSLGPLAEEYRLDTAMRVIITFDEQVLGTTLAALRLAFRGMDGETATLPVLTSPGAHRDWFRELHRRMQAAPLPLAVTVA